MHAEYPFPSPFILAPANRLALMLLCALLLHLILLLALGFEWPDPPPRPPLNLEITLVHSHSDRPPDQADYLAQSHQQGGGESSERLRPASPLPTPQPIIESASDPITAPPRAPPPRPRRQEVITTPAAAPPITNPIAETPLPPIADALPSAQELMRRSREIARLSAEIAEHQQAYAQQPRTRYITANVREYNLAAYEDAWRQKIERIGNLNYPDEARRRNLSGTLILDVAIRADGSLAEVQVIRSSGIPALDDGARRIVELSAPFAPFTPAMRSEIDRLHIVRTWQFQPNHRFATE
jgi:periplasmic protein TonB